MYLAVIIDSHYLIAIKNFYCHNHSEKKFNLGSPRSRKMTFNKSFSWNEFHFKELWKFEFLKKKSCKSILEWLNYLLKSLLFNVLNNVFDGNTVPRKHLSCKFAVFNILTHTFVPLKIVHNFYHSSSYFLNCLQFLI